MKYIFEYFFILILSSSLCDFVLAARPSDCSSQTYPVLQTITLDAADTDYTLSLSCTYNLGLSFKGATTSTSLSKVRVYVTTSAIKSKFSVDSTLTFSAGSQFIVSGCTISDMAIVDIYGSLAAGYIAFLQNNIVLTGNGNGGLIVGSAMSVSAGSSIAISQNVIGTTGGTTQLVRVGLMSTGIALTIPVLISDNAITCASSCMYISGAANATVTKNKFVSTTATTTTSYTLFGSAFTGGFLTWDSSNQLQINYIFSYVASSTFNAFGPSTVMLNGTRPQSLTISLTDVKSPGQSIYNFSGVSSVTASSIAIGSPSSVTTDFSFSSWGASLAVAGTFPTSSALRLHAIGVATYLSLTVYIYGSLTIEDSSFGSYLDLNIFTIDAASVYLRRNTVVMAGSTYAIHLDWLRTGTGTPSLYAEQNNVRFTSNYAASYRAFEIASNDAANVPTNIYITDNSFDMGASSGIILTVQNADMIIQRNVISANSALITARMISSRITLDDSNAYNVNGGSLLVSHTQTPRNGNKFNVSGVRISSAVYEVVTTTASPTNEIIEISNSIFSDYISVALAKAVAPRLVIYGILTFSSTSRSSIQVKGIDFYHNYSTYNGGLNLAIDAVNTIVLRNLIIGGTGLSWTVNAPKFLSVQYNILPAVEIIVMQDAQDHRVEVDHNIIISANPYSSNNGYYGLVVDWERLGVGTAYLSVFNNSITFTSSSASSQALYLNSNDVTTTSNMVATVSANFISANSGRALRLLCKNADVTVTGNILYSTTSYLLATLTSSRISFDRTNTFNINGGSIDIAHTTPRDGSYFNVTGLRSTYISYTILTTATPSGHFVSITDVLLTTFVIVAMGGAINPQLTLTNIQVTGSSATKSSYQMTTSDSFTHSYSRYDAGLDMAVSSPTNISANNLILGATSRWILNARRYVNVFANNLAAIELRVDQDLADHMLWFDHNTILSDNPYSSTGGLYFAVYIDWFRNGVGTSLFSFTNNSISFKSASGSSSALALYSDDQGSTNLNAIISDNRINAFAGRAINLFLRDADATIVRNNLTSTGVYLDADLNGCRMTWDQTNTYNINGGDIDIITTNPRDGNIFDVSGQRISSVSYQILPAAAAPKLEFVRITNMILAQNLFVAMAAAYLPTFLLANIHCSSTSPSSTIQVSSIDFWHESCTYPGGLTLTVNAPRNITLTDLTIGGVGNRWTLVAPLSLKVLNSALPGIELILSQTMTNHEVIINGNTLLSSNPYSSAFSMYYGLILSWTRAGVGTALLSVVSNTIRFTSTGGATRGICIRSSGATSTAAVAYFHNNDVANPNGICFDLQMENSDLTFSATTLSTINVGITASLTSSRISLNESNHHSMNGGIINIIHAATPRNGNMLNITGQRIDSIVYTIPATSSPLNERIIVSDVVLDTRLVIAMGNAQLPTLRIMNIQAGTSKSSIQVKTLDMVHNFSTYPGGLDLDIDAPQSILLHNLVIGAPSNWVLTSGRYLNINSCSLPAVLIQTKMIQENPTLIFESNTVVSTNPYTSAYAVYYAVILDWKRTGTGTGTFSFQHNTVSFVSQGTSSRGLYLTAVQGSGSAPTNTIATIYNNSIRALSGLCFDLTIDSAVLTIQQNTFAATSAGVGLKAVLKDVRVIIDDSNLHSQNGGDVSIVHTAPRSNNYVNISLEVIGSFTYTHPDAAVTTGDVILINSITLAGAIVVSLGSSVNPTLLAHKITAGTGKSIYQLKSADFIHSDCSYAGGLDLTIDALLNMTLSNIVSGATSSWTITAPAVMQVIGCQLGATIISIAQTYVDPVISFLRNTVVSGNPYVSAYATYYAVIIDWSRNGFGKAKFQFSQNSISFISSSSSSAALLFRSTGATSTPMVATIANNILTAPTGTALSIALDNADITIQQNTLSTTKTSLAATFNNARITFDDSNEHILGGGDVLITHASTPRNGSFVSIINERIGGVTYSVPLNAVTMDDVLVIDTVELTKALTVQMGKSKNLFLVLERITAATQSSIQASGTEFVHHDSSYAAGLDLSIESVRNITLYNLAVVGVSTWTLVCPVGVTILDNKLGATYILPLTTGMNPIFDMERNVITSSNPYSSTYAQYVGVVISWTRNAAGLATMIVADNTVSFTSSSSSSRGMRIISSTAGWTNTQGTIVRNTISSGTGWGLGVEFSNIDLKVTSNTFVNTASGSAMSFAATLYSSRITFDDSNTISVDGGGLSIVHSMAPRPNNVLVSRARISSITYSSSTTAPIVCDRVVIVGAAVTNGITISLPGDVTDTEITVWGSSSTGTSSRCEFSVLGIYNSFVRIEGNNFGAGIDLEGYTAHINATLLFTRNTAGANAVFKIGGSMATIDVRGNTFTTVTTAAALALQLYLSGSPVVLLADNRMEVTGSRISVTTTCAAWGPGPQTLQNATLVVSNNFMTGTGSASLFACRGTTVMRNNYLNPNGVLSHTVSLGGSLMIDSTDGNVYTGALLSFTAVAGALLMTVDLRSTQLLGLTFTSASTVAGSRLRLQSVRISGDLTVTPNAGASSALFVSDCSVMGSSTVSLAGTAGTMAFVEVLRSLLTGGLTMTIGSIASTVLISKQSAIIVANCNIQSKVTLTFADIAFPYVFSNNSVTTAASTTSTVVANVDNAFGELYGNTWFQGASSAAVTMTLGGTSTYAGGHVISKNNFQIAYTIASKAYGMIEYRYNTFGQTFRITTVLNMKIHIFGNTFTGVTTRSFAAGTVSSDALQSGCNQDGSGPMALTSWDTRFVELTCAGSTNVGFCWGLRTYAITQPPSDLCEGPIPEADSQFNAVDSWISIPISVSDYFAAYGGPVLVRPLADKCSINPSYAWNNTVWPPIAPPTTLPTVSTTTHPSGTSPTSTHFPSTRSTTSATTANPSSNTANPSDTATTAVPSGPTVTANPSDATTPTPSSSTANPSASSTANPSDTATTAVPSGPTVTANPSDATTPSSSAPLHTTFPEWPTTSTSQTSVECPDIEASPTDIFVDSSTDFTITVTSRSRPFLLNASFKLAADDFSETGLVLRCEGTGSHSVVCLLPANMVSGRYRIISDGLVFQPIASCSSVLSASINFARAYTSANEASDAVATVAASSASLLSLLSAADIQMYAMLMNSQCSSHNDRQRTSVLLYFVSPFVDLGNTWVILGNTAIFVFVGVFQALLASYFVKSRRVKWVDACAACRFPSISYAIAGFLYIGIARSTFAVFNLHETMVEVVGLFGLVVLIAVPVFCLHLIRTVFVGKWVPYTQFYSKPTARRWLYPDGYWYPPEQRKPFDGMFLFCRVGRLYAAPYNLVVIILASMFLMAFGDAIPCYERFIVVAVIFFVAAAWIAIVRPHRRILSAALEVISYLLLGILCVLKATLINDPGNDSALDVDSGIGYLFIVVVLVRVVSDIVYIVLETRYWMKFQLPEADEDVEKEGKDRALLDADNGKGDVHILPMREVATGPSIEMKSSLIFQMTENPPVQQQSLPTVVHSGMPSPTLTSKSGSSLDSDFDDLMDSSSDSSASTVKVEPAPTSHDNF